MNMKYLDQHSQRNKADYKEGRDSILVPIKEVESIITRENNRQFKLAYMLFLLESKLLRELGISGEGVNLVSYPGAL